MCPVARNSAARRYDQWTCRRRLPQLARRWCRLTTFVAAIGTWVLLVGDVAAAYSPEGSSASDGSEAASRAGTLVFVGVCVVLAGAGLLLIVSVRRARRGR